jgi:hypothetical protein
LGDVNTGLRSSDFNDGSTYSWSDLKNHLIKKEKARVIIPVFMIDHSGIAIIGYIFISEDKIRHEFNQHRITKKLCDRARAVLLSEIQEYNAYLTGEYVGYEVIEPIAGQTIESCWGYSDIQFILDEFKDQIYRRAG